MDLKMASHRKLKTLGENGELDVPVEHFRYDAVLEIATAIGLFLLLAAFSAYIAGASARFARSLAGIVGAAGRRLRSANQRVARLGLRQAPALRRNALAGCHRDTLHGYDGRLRRARCGAWQTERPCLLCDHRPRDHRIAPSCLRRPNVHRALASALVRDDPERASRYRA